MHTSKITPERILQPIQLWAAWLVTMAFLCWLFLSMATKLESPKWWGPSVLVGTAVSMAVITPAVLCLLMVCFRTHLLDNTAFKEHFKQQSVIKALASKLSEQSVDLEHLIRVAPLKQPLSRTSGDTSWQVLDNLSRRIKQVGTASVKYETQLKIAKGLLNQHRWSEAADILDGYTQARPEEWSAHVFRAIAHDNSRQDVRSTKSALEAYNDAIAFLPNDIDTNFKARLLTYCGAMKKRLRRLDEAKVDFQHALSLATQTEVKHDIQYNLASVYAMQGDRSKAQSMIEKLRDAPRELSLIRKHIDDYFQLIRDDQKVQEILHLGQNITQHSAKVVIPKQQPVTQS